MAATSAGLAKPQLANCHLTCRHPRLTQLLELGLVAVAGGDGLLLGLGSRRLGLESGNPAVALGGAGSLESVLVAVDLEVELVALLGDITNIGLRTSALAHRT